MSSSSEEVEVYDEKPEDFDTYADASIASCKWVNSGKAKIVPAELALYTSRLKKSSAYGKVVGVGIKPKSGSKEPVPYVRLDIDPTKGIHFNATQLSDSSKKLAAIIKPSLKLTPAAREALYQDYVKALQNRSAQFIWQWWETGIAPS